MQNKINEENEFEILKIECSILNDEFKEDDESFEKDYDGEVDRLIEKTLRMLSTHSKKAWGSGLYQFLLAVLILLVYTVDIGFYTIVNVFASFTPTHQCYTNHNVTQPLGKCEILNLTTNETSACDKWVYDNSLMKSTIITEFDFVCKRNYYFELIFTLEQMGFVFGTVFLGVLTNKFGKKPTLLFIIATFSVLGIVQYWIKSFYFYMLLGFFMNFFVSGLDGICVGLLLEAFDASHRTKYGMLFSYTWSIGSVLMAPIAYIIKTWREIRLVIFLISSVVSVIGLFVIQESLMWLISSGKIIEAERVIKKISIFNRISKDETFKTKFENTKKSFQQLARYNEKKALKRNKDDRKNIYLEIFKHKKFILYIFLMILSWCSAGMVYDGLNYLNATIGDNIFINWLFLTVIEIPASVACHYLNAKYGRRIVACLSFILAGIMLLLAGLNQLEIIKTYSFIQTGLFVLAKFFNSISYSTLIIHTAEVFPTRIRSFCCGLCVFSNRLITSVAPFISLYITKIVPWLPATIYGVISITCGIFYLYTPETFNKPLPNSIEEILENNNNNNNKKRTRLCC